MDSTIKLHNLSARFFTTSPGQLPRIGIFWGLKQSGDSLISRPGDVRQIPSGQTK
jgi:hypothetical protein